jgi:putative lipoic acid-binding regulatory protein
MYRTKSWMLLVIALSVLPHFSSVEAQWVMAAHAAKNRIQQMKQKSSNGGYDVAIVLLEAAPTAVYDKTLKTLQTHPDVKITKNDSKNGRIEIKQGSNGRRVSDYGAR